MSKRNRWVKWSDLDDRQRMTCLCIAQFDMYQALYARNFAAELSKDADDSESDLFVVASDMAAIRYARPFRRSVPLQSNCSPALPDAPYLDHFSESEWALHVRVLALRDQVMAHSDHKRRNVHVGLFLDPEDGNVKVRSHIDHEYLGKTELSLLLDMLLKVLQPVEKDIAEMQPHVLPKLTLQSGKVSL